MAAYLVVLARVLDPEKFISGYAPRAAELTAQYGGRYVMRAPGATPLEGSLGNGYSVVISEWEDRAAAERFWHSEDYRQAAKLREGICDIEVQLVEGELALGDQ